MRNNRKMGHRFGWSMVSIATNIFLAFTVCFTVDGFHVQQRRQNESTRICLSKANDNHPSLSNMECPEAKLVNTLNNTPLSRSGFLSLGLFTAMAAPSMVQASTHTPISKEPPADYHSQRQRNDDEKNLYRGSSNLLSAMVSNEPTSFQESISGFVAGAALAASKTLLKFPLDTATVRLQVPNSGYSLLELGRLFQGSYNGVTLSLLSNIPGGAVFFAVKDATKASLKANGSWTSLAPRWVTTTLAVGVALIPYWAIRNPSEVIKVRQQVGVAGCGDGISAVEAAQLTFRGEDGQKSSLEGLQTLYTGYGENILYGLPADVIKFVAYEAFTGGRRDLSPLEGARAGAFATATAQLISTPFDVIRNRRMSEEEKGDMEQSQNYVESLLELGRTEGLAGLFAGGTPRVAKAFLGGAIQFAMYEETKQSIGRLLLQGNNK